MDTKSKNSPDLVDRIIALYEKMKRSHTFIVTAVILLIAMAAWNMVSCYSDSAEVIEQDLVEEEATNEILSSVVQDMVNGNRFLYAQCHTPESEDALSYAAMMETYGNNEFFLLKKFLAYELIDDTAEEGEELLLSSFPESSQGKLADSADSYSLWARFTYDETGNLQNAEIKGAMVEKQLQYQLEQICYEYNMVDNEIHETIDSPQNVTVVYGITESSLKEYMGLANSDNSFENYNEGRVTYYNDSGEVISLSIGEVVGHMYVWAFIFILAAVFIPFNKAWHVGEERIFRVSLEWILFVWFWILNFSSAFEYTLLIPTMGAAAHYTGNAVEGMLQQGYGFKVMLNLAVWCVVFAAVFWSAVCLRSIFTMKGEYVNQRIWSVRKYRKWKAKREEHKKAVAEGRAQERHFSLKRSVKNVWNSIKETFRRIYDALLHIDFQNKTNRTILGIVVLNFFVLLVITWLWYYGVFALLVYSVLLFLFLRKYFEDIRRKYMLLQESTNQLAAGNLDVEIEGDFGIYNPVKEDLKKIQDGFQKAVQKEVKSERMKTELITNVSHDLKTPLTAIITYVDLLKNEQDEQKRKEYLEILERKSQRLKVLIEDLFEISKAASKNVTLNLMNVDIVGLLKQAVFEQEDKIKASNLKFRWRLPEGKVVMALDSQKTYRIFENLVVNITKYALPGTRAYVDMEVSDKEVAVTMKNVSATELDFNTDEITDRFVRGDTSRNTEGSGLGLAIVKSFTELQRGTLEITTEADLFKICVRLPRRLVEPEQMEETVAEQAAETKRPELPMRYPAQESGREW